MSKAMTTVGLIMLSILVLVLINVITNYTTGNQLDYYLLKETTQAAMTDSIDMDYYHTKGIYRVDKEKFEESFVLRFADTVDNRRGYRISMYDFHEIPPKVSIKVESSTSYTFNQKNIAITTEITSIVESTNKTDPISYYYLNNVN